MTACWEWLLRGTALQGPAKPTGPCVLSYLACIAGPPHLLNPRRAPPSSRAARRSVAAAPEAAAGQRLHELPAALLTRCQPAGRQPVGQLRTVVRSLASAAQGMVPACPQGSGRAGEGPHPLLPPAPPTHLTTRLPSHLTAHPPTRPPAHPPTRLPTHPPNHPPAPPPNRPPPTHPSAHTLTRLPPHPSARPPALPPSRPPALPPTRPPTRPPQVL